MMRSSRQSNVYGQQFQNEKFIQPSQDKMFRSIQNNYIPPNSNKPPFYKSPLFIGIFMLFILSLIGLMVYLYYNKSKESDADKKDDKKTTQVFELYISGHCGGEKFIVLNNKGQKILKEQDVKKLVSTGKMDDYKFTINTSSINTMDIKFTNDRRDPCDRNLRLYTKIKVDGSEKSITVKRSNGEIYTTKQSYKLTDGAKEWYPLPWGGSYNISW